jgi:hypothetical protein
MVAALVVVSAAAAAIAAARGSGPALAASSPSLKGICPDKIVVQTDWFPQPDQGGTFQLIGPGGKVDKKKGTYTGPLGKTGVQLEIRAGGPYIGQQQPVAQMYAHSDIMFGFADTADQIRNSGKLPTVAVMAPMEKSPVGVVWDPKHYQFKSWADIKRSKATVLYFEGDTWMDFLLSRGLLDHGQVDGSFDGSPNRFVSSGGSVVEEAYATDKWKYQHTMRGWMKPVNFLLAYNAGYKAYQSSIVTRPSTVTKYAACLKKLVPLWQQAVVSYVRNPKPVNNELLKIVKELASYWTLTPGGVADAAKTMRQLNIVGNGSNRTLGDFDLQRVQDVIHQFVPMFEKRNVKTMKANLKAQDIVTNRFIDQRIHL